MLLLPCIYSGAGAAEALESASNNFQVRPYMLIERIEDGACAYESISSAQSRNCRMCCQPPSSLCSKETYCPKKPTCCTSASAPCRKPRKKVRRCPKTNNYYPLPFTPPVVMVNCATDAPKNETDSVVKYDR